jgi:hypothetical protein
MTYDVLKTFIFLKQLNTINSRISPSFLTMLRKHLVYCILYYAGTQGQILIVCVCVCIKTQRLQATV